MHVKREANLSTVIELKSMHGLTTCMQFAAEYPCFKLSILVNDKSPIWKKLLTCLLACSECHFGSKEKVILKWQVESR